MLNIDENIIEQLKQKVAQISEEVGVYLHKDEHNKILYVGKAKNLQSRLKSYFSNLNKHSSKTLALVKKIKDFETIIVNNEKEALILENNLIKHYKPSYNILLRDDKTYPYIKIDNKTEWIRIYKSRKRVADGCLYFGPFTDGYKMLSLLNFINRYFPLVKCNEHVFNSVSRPCNYYRIKKCLGPCKLTVNKEIYYSYVNNIIAILEGKTKDICKKLKKEMIIASDNMNYELAGELRDQIKAIQMLDENQSIILYNEINMDIISTFWSINDVCFQVNSFLDGTLISNESFVFDITEIDNTIYEYCETFVCQFYQKRTVPKMIIIYENETESDKSQIQNIKLFLENISRGICDILFTQNIKEITKYLHENILLKHLKFSNLEQSLTKAINTILNNTKHAYDEKKQNNEKAQNYMNSLQTFLAINFLPTYIECYDISTIQGTETVASQVVFKNGVVSKHDYKMYRIKTVDGQNDFASLREVIFRRFNEENRSFLPNILLIDGGEPQIREVAWVIKSLGLEDIFLLGIAKARKSKRYEDKLKYHNERLVIPYRNTLNEIEPNKPMQSKNLKVGSNEFKFITQIRNEAHRFAITFHRKRRDKVSRTSLLHKITGLGPKRRKQLLNIYPDYKIIINEPTIEIAQKTKIPVTVIEELQKQLKKLLLLD